MVTRLDAVLWLVGLFVVACAPLGVIAAGRLRRHRSAPVRALGRVVGFVLLWLAFELSFLAIWGATARHAPYDVVLLLVTLLLMQPVAVLVSLRVVDGAAPEDPRNSSGD